MTQDYLDAHEQADLVRRGEVSARDLVDAAIDRIIALDDDINAVTIRRFEQARAEAASPVDGPFFGVPYLIKDHTLSTVGDLHSQGSAGLKNAGFRGNHDSFLVQSMRNAGFILLGKTNLPELALGPTTEPAAFGPTRNPWDLTKSAGGSSGGSAAAVAAGYVPLAEGTDGGGSGRMPASHCGVLGLKPSRGRISSGPQINAADNVHGMGTEALLGRSVRDLAAVLDIVHGHRPGEAYGAPTPATSFLMASQRPTGSLKIGVLRTDPTGGNGLHPEAVAAVDDAAKLLEQLGHEVREGHPAALADPTWLAGFMACAPVIVARELKRLGALIGRDLTPDDVEPSTWALAAMADGVTAEAYSSGVDSLREFQGRVESWWADDQYDLLLTPTMPYAAPPLGNQGGPGDGMFVPGLTPDAFVTPFNVTGQPAISLPLHMTADGLPLGVQLVAAFGREDHLLAVAAAAEQALPWAARVPAAASRTGR